MIIPLLRRGCRGGAAQRCWADARAAPPAHRLFEVGRWEVLFETQEESEWRAHLRGLRAAGSQIDWAMTRIDTLYGQWSQPTTYRLSLFVLRDTTA
jgi:hypothetical protein